MSEDTAVTGPDPDRGAVDPAGASASAAPSPPGRQFNLSSWTLEHRAFVVFLVVLITLFGVVSYGKLAQSEDPPFTFKTMVVETFWPGATGRQVAEEVTDRI